MKTVTVVAGQTIELGYQYDNYATEVVFPSDIVTPFITNFGSTGTFAIWYRRSGDSLGYPIGNPLVTFNSTNNTITWQVVEADTANPGTAQVQLRYIIDEVCVMSQMFTGVVSDSVDVGEEVPEALEQWADAIVTAGAGGQPVAVALASQMTSTSKIYLYMGSESGYTYNHIYYWNGSSWVDGGAYGGGSTGSGLTEDVKQALLACFENVAWISEDGQGYVDALESALYPPVNLLSITATYTQSGTVYDTDTLDSLKSDLVVTANYEDGTSSAVSDYTLSGTLAEGTSTITVTYGGKTTTFSVTVSEYVPQYVTSGLVHNWDAINNTGNGHDSTATVWKDLVGNVDISKVTDGTWSENSLDFAPTAVSSSQSWKSSENITYSDEMTIEMCIEPTEVSGDSTWGGSNTAVVAFVYSFNANKNRGIFIIKADNSVGGFANKQNSFASTGYNSLLDINSITATYTQSSDVNTLYVNGESKTKGLNHTFSRSSVQTGIWLGGYGTSGGTDKVPFHGKIHALRIYNRVLTAEEIAQNHSADVYRYGLGA